MSPALGALSHCKIILASSSPQRKQLLEQIGLTFQILPSLFDEESVSKDSFKNPKDYVKIVAQGKALAVAEVMIKEGVDCVVVGADTVISHDGKIIGKPHTSDVAVATLRKLSNKTHTVCTGVATVQVNSGRKTVLTFDEVTEVKFGPLSDEQIVNYVSTGEPLNKAGSYGIQGIGAILVESIKGDYNNVVGFPIYRFCREIEKFLNSNTET